MPTYIETGTTNSFVSVVDTEVCEAHLGYRKWGITMDLCGHSIGF
jgi:hypothetical protein